MIWFGQFRERGNFAGSFKIKFLFTYFKMVLEDIQEKKISFRKNEISTEFIKFLNQHVTELGAGTVENAMEIKEIADLMFIDPNHLSDTIAEVLGKSPCTIYEEMLLSVSNELLAMRNPLRTATRCVNGLY